MEQAVSEPPKWEPGTPLRAYKRALREWSWRNGKDLRAKAQVLHLVKSALDQMMRRGEVIASDDGYRLAPAPGGPK